MSKAIQSENRRKFLKLAGVGVGLLSTSAQTGAQTESTDQNIDLVISVSKELPDGQNQDLGGVHYQNYPLSFLAQAACCVAPELAEGATGLTWQAPMAADSAAIKPSEAKMEFNFVGGNALRLERFICQGEQSVTLDMGVELVVSDNPQILSEERIVDGVMYRFFGVLMKSKQDVANNAVTTAKAGDKNAISIINIIDTGRRQLPFTNKDYRFHGPERHALDPCRYEQTWHMNLLLYDRGAWSEFSNSHIGLYRQGSQYCLIFFHAWSPYICKKYCTPRVPSWSEAYNFAYQAIDELSRYLRISLPYLAIATLATLFASAVFSSLLLLAL